jgi:hypothetical protein
LWHQPSLNKHFKNKHESFFRWEYWHPYDAISQGTVIPGVPLISEALKCVLLVPEAIVLKTEIGLRATRHFEILLSR